MSYDSIIGNFKNEIDKLDNKRKSHDEQSKLLKTYRSKILKFKKKILKLLFDYNLINEKTSAIFELIITKLSIHIENYCKSSNVTLLKNYFTQFTKILNKNIIEGETLSNSQPFKSKIVQTPPRSPSPKLVTRPRTPELRRQQTQRLPLRTPELRRQQPPPKKTQQPIKKSPFNFKPDSDTENNISNTIRYTKSKSKSKSKNSLFNFNHESNIENNSLQLPINKFNKLNNKPFTHKLYSRLENITGYISSKLPAFKSPMEEPLSANNLAKGDITRNQALNERELLNLRLLTINRNTCFFDSILVSLFINNNVFYELFFGQNAYTELVEPKNNFYDDQRRIINDIKETIKNVVDNMYKQNNNKNNVEKIRTKFHEHNRILSQNYFNQNIVKEFEDFINGKFAGVDGFLMGLLEIFQIPYNFKILTSKGEYIGNFITNTNANANLPVDYPFLLFGRHTENVLRDFKPKTDDSREISSIIKTYYVKKLDIKLQSNILHFFNKINIQSLIEICGDVYYKILFSLYKLIDMDSFIDYLYSKHFNNLFRYYDNYLHYISAFSGLPYDTFKVNLPEYPTKDDLKQNITTNMKYIGSIIENNKFKNFDELDTEVARLERLFNNPEYTPPDIIRQDRYNYKLISIIIGPKIHYTALITYNNRWYFYDDGQRIFIKVANSYNELIHNNHNDFKMRAVLYVYVLQR
jgi:hypothetical protein